MSRPTRRIAVLIDSRLENLLRALTGVATYAQRRPDWDVCRSRVQTRAEFDQRFPDGVDGVIGPIRGHSADNCLLSLIDDGLPVVNLVEGSHREGLHTVGPDNREAGRLAARCLLDRGVRTFGYVDGGGRIDDPIRREGFTDEVHAARRPCEYAFGGDIYRPADRAKAVERLCRWLGEVTTPVGIMAFNDQVGRAVVDAAHQAGLTVPDDVAVIGVDNSESECELSRPRLASVDLAQDQVGFLAAGRLDHLIDGAPIAHPLQRVPPRGVVERQSSEIVAVDDPIVNRAIRLIRAEATNGLVVEEVLKATSVSRTWLDGEFRKHFGHTVHEEIWNRRVAAALSLLVDTDLPMTIVADRAGFSSLAHLSRTIRDRTGMPPTAFRQRHRMALV